MVIAYYASWKAPVYPVQQIPADQLTHIYYAFAHVSADGLCVLGDPQLDLHQESGVQFGAGEGSLRGNFAALKHLKEQHPHLKILISIGGWGASQHFSPMAQTAESRARFIDSAISQFLLGSFPDIHPENAIGIFDGFDLDWEYPTEGGLEGNLHHPEDAQNFTLLMQEFRVALDLLSQDTGQHYELSIAVAAAPKRITNDLHLKDLSEILERINLMTYDFTGEVGPVTTFHNNLFAVEGAPFDLQYSTHLTVQTALRLGVVPEKLVLGLPFYGRMWRGVNRDNNGLYQPNPGEFSDVDLSYRNLIDKYLVPESGFEPFYHLEAEVPYLFNPDSGEFITYENPRSIRSKVFYGKARGLQGVMFWELAQDNGELLNTIHQMLDKQD
ncbi:hypothetical protein DC3_05400 [Deinococcus cellulosilyticus NBRC 106333 = KACC 11606]|uniref:chitinase n=1 Tax=Deinococcus cellulosilyticus (strain DSM 18568 / NBRC 106333 / KACC 11606 / 5516J-15) TaxID=1223518 RepID=A0A511MWE5_DEIC1|nr:hypothetical protein DC3_05400 [Deinococcus cellulosilyticus NBRC 106333 = KACC 11606]